MTPEAAAFVEAMVEREPAEVQEHMRTYIREHDGEVLYEPIGGAFALWIDAHIYAEVMLGWADPPMTTVTPAFPEPQPGDITMVYFEMEDFDAMVIRQRGVTVTRLTYERLLKEDGEACSAIEVTPA